MSFCFQTVLIVKQAYLYVMSALSGVEMFGPGCDDYRTIIVKSIPTISDIDVSSYHKTGNYQASIR